MLISLMLQHIYPSSSFRTHNLVLGGLLVDVGLAVVGLLVDLVADSITGSLGAGSERRIAILGYALVGLLGSGGAGALDGLADVVCGVPGVKLLGLMLGMRNRES